MHEKLIYEKKFPPIDDLDLDFTERSVTSEADRISFDEYLRELRDQIIYTPIPERIENSEKFIQKAIEFSERHEIDVTIKQFDHYINAEYYLDSFSTLSDTNNLFSMTDEFYLINDIHGYEVALSLNYFTHSTTYKNKVINPQSPL